MMMEPEIPPSAPGARIPARTRRLAMDWGLVLASQGVPAVIADEPEWGWVLVVPVAEEARAREAIRLYRQENLRWPWRRRVLKQEFVFDWAAIVWVLLVMCFHYVAESQPAVQSAGIMDTKLFGQGEWWRVFTAVWLHGNYAHLAANAGFGLILLGLALGHYGTGLGLLAAYLAGAGGNVGDWVLYGPAQRSLGASGMVMGALGLLAVQSFALRRELAYAKRMVLGGLAGAVMLFTMLGLSPDSDVVAHLGGFVCGIGLGALLSWRPGLARKTGANLIAGVVFVGLVVIPWWRAFAH